VWNANTRRNPEARPPKDPGDNPPEEDDWIDPDLKLFLQLETRPISHDQLVAEPRGIYAGLVMVKAKCIDIDEKQIVAAQERDPTEHTKLTAEQWMSLIPLHKTLINEHHDFLLASDHPAASSKLYELRRYIPMSN